MRKPIDNQHTQTQTHTLYTHVYMQISFVFKRELHFKLNNVLTV